MLRKILMCCISDMVGYAQPAFGVVIEQVAQSLNIRTILSFPPKNVILTLHITMTLVISLSGFPLSRYLGRDWFIENNAQTWQLHTYYLRNYRVAQVNCAHKVPVLRNQEYFFYYHPDICLNIYLKCFVFPWLFVGWQSTIFCHMAR